MGIIERSILDIARSKLRRKKGFCRLTPEKAEAAFDAAPPVPISPSRIEEIGRAALVYGATDAEVHDPTDPSIAEEALERYQAFLRSLPFVQVGLLLWSGLAWADVVQSTLFAAYRRINALEILEEAERNRVLREMLIDNLLEEELEEGARGSGPALRPTHPRSQISEDTLRESLGAAIREHRKTHGMTLTDLANKSEVSLGALSQIELGKTTASFKTLHQIAVAMGVRIDELFVSM